MPVVSSKILLLRRLYRYTTIGMVSKQLLDILVANLSQQPAMIQGTTFLFLKLLSYDTTPLLLAPIILSYLSNEEYPMSIPMWGLADSLFDISKEHLTRLANFATHEDAKVQQGAITLWADSIEFLFSRYFLSKQPSELKILRSLNFDWKFNLSLIKSIDIAQRKRAIILLTYSHFPIKEAQYFTELQSVIAQAEDSSEIAAWSLFLRNVPVSKPEKKAWQKLLETLLDTPQSYSPHILMAAMERYTELEGVTGPEIKDEHALDLPVLAFSKKEQTGKGKEGVK